MVTKRTSRILSEFGMTCNVYLTAAESYASKANRPTCYNIKVPVILILLQRHFHQSVQDAATVDKINVARSLKHVRRLKAEPLEAPCSLILLKYKTEIKLNL